MRQVVADAFPMFTRDFEGAVGHMYLDRRGFVTTGYGDLINDTPSVTALPWRRRDGSLARRDEVMAEWAAVRNLRGARDQTGVLWTDRGGGAFSTLTSLRLDAEAVDSLVRATMARNDGALAKRYAEWDSWPACAQMACMSLAWACGTAYEFPKMDAALALRDFAAASREIEMPPEHNQGNDLRRRNAANELLMVNAARVDTFHLDPDLLEWRDHLDVSDEVTQPALDNPASSPTIYVGPILHDPNMYRLDEEPDEPA